MENKEMSEIIETKVPGMALPPKGKDSVDEKKKKRHLFSWPIFLESLKSNKIWLLISTFGNSLIIILIICILSTIKINSTKDSLQNMFSNADTETTVRTSAIGLYAGYENTADGFLTFDDTLTSLTSAEKEGISQVQDLSTVSQMTSLKKAYDTVYSLQGGTDEEKAKKSKALIMSQAKSTLDGDSTKTEEEKEVLLQAISDFFDEYEKDKTKTVEQVLVSSMPYTLTAAVSKKETLTSEQKEKSVLLLSTAFDSVINKSMDITSVTIPSAIDWMSVLSSGDLSSFVESTGSELKKAYAKDPSSYVSDKTVKENILSRNTQSYVVKELSDYAYYPYLPDFEVDYITSERGYPITYVDSGKTNSYGEIIYEEKELDTYAPDQFVGVIKDMGVNANMLQKMHKEAITGVPYTDEEISKAKEDSQDSLDKAKEEISKFMDDFLARDSDNKNAYFDGTSLIPSAVIDRAVDTVVENAKVTLVDTFNKDHEEKIDSYLEITAKNNDTKMTGESMLSTVRGYATGGIATYNDALKEAEGKENYSEMDKVMVSLEKGETTVMSQLPNKVGQTLTDMATHNLYGFAVGVVSFSIVCVLIPMVYTILLATNLVSGKVETGSLAFTLSTPTTRNSYIFTEGAYLFFTEFVMALSLFLATLVSRQIAIGLGATDLITSLTVSNVFFYSLGNFMVTLGLSGVCFLFSCLFDKSDMSIGVGGGICIFFFICSVLGLFGSKSMPVYLRIDGMNTFNYVTIFSLFDPMAVMDGDYKLYFFKLLFLLVITGITYTAGSVRFCHKDLPL
ncbi:MAG: ABC transporter permease [Bacilli bacterium]